MSRQWKPGDVALVEAGCWANQKVALRLAEGWAHTNGVNVDGDGVIEVVRPLVVIDPESEDDAEAIVRAFVKTGCWRVIPSDVEDSHAHRREQVAAALREFAAPVPPEPTNPAARVTDRRDNTWRLLADGEWVCVDGPDIGEYLTWDRLVADRSPVEVVS